jgi:hypothetical protein
VTDFELALRRMIREEVARQLRSEAEPPAEVGNVRPVVVLGDPSWIIRDQEGREVVARKHPADWLCQRCHKHRDKVRYLLLVGEVLICDECVEARFK